MTERRWTRFAHNLVANRLYESSNPNPIEVITDADQNDRVITKKDMHWKWDAANGYVYTNDAVKSTLNNDDNDYIIKIQGSLGESGSFYGYDMLGMYGVCDIAAIYVDELSSGRTLICSRSSGLWTLSHSSSMITLAHVANSPCCVSISFDKYQSQNANGYYILTANNECYDVYDITTNETTIVIASVKKLNNGSTFDFTKMVTVDNATHTASVFIIYDGSNRVAVDKRSCDLSGNKLATNGHKLITYSYGGNPVLYIKIGHGNAKSNGAGTTQTIGISTTVASPVINTYATESTGWGMIYYAAFDGATTMPGSWTNVSSRLGRYKRCPSVISVGVGTDTSSSSKNVYYFGTDDFNDYISGYEIIDVISGVLFVGNDGAGTLWTQNTLTINRIYYVRETSGVVTGDVWVLCSNLGILSLQGQTNGAYAYTTWSGSELNTTIGGVTYSVTNYARLMVGGSKHEFAFDNTQNVMTGIYELHSDWYKTWTNHYHLCDLNDANGIAIAVVDYPCFAKVIDNENLIYAATVGVNSDEEGLYYCVPAVYNANVFNKLYTYPAGKSFVDLIKHGDDLMLILNDRTVVFRNFGTATASSIGMFKTKITSLTNVLMYSKSAEPHDVISIPLNCAINNGTVITADALGGVGVVESGEMTGENTITINGTITGPTITDIYNKLSIIRNALGLN